MRKTYFSERTYGQIKEQPQLAKASRNLIENIVNMDYSEGGLIIENRLIPTEYRSPRKFMKHGNEVNLRDPKYSENSSVGEESPLNMMTRAFDNLSPGFYSSYSFRPSSFPDQRKRKVSLVECLKGAQIYSYSKTQNVPIIVKAYDKSRRVEIEGAEAIIEVPSRTRRDRRYLFKLSSIPVIDSPTKFAVASSLSSDHNCNRKRFNIKFNYLGDKENSREINFCAHEIAGYFILIEDYINKKNNTIPLQMNPFAIPTEFTVDFFKKLRNNCLIRIENNNSIAEGKERLRKLNNAEMEILLWGLVQKEGHEKTFLPKNKFKDYNWK